MKTNGKSPLKWTIILVAAIALAGLAWGMSAQTSPTAPSAVGTSSVFTPAHSSFPEAAKHFFGIRPTPVQPIGYTHTVHVNKVKMECVQCHVGVDKGPVASIPGVKTCMGCHEFMEDLAKEKPEVQKILDYSKRNEEIPWQRVYGWPEESHVRFNHAPHIRSKVDCATCHGDVPSMTVATRVMSHSMGFCVSCHEQRKASNDCLTCHY
jgi:hypothetical protein